MATTCCFVIEISAVRKGQVEEVSRQAHVNKGSLFLEDMSQIEKKESGRESELRNGRYIFSISFLKLNPKRKADKVEILQSRRTRISNEYLMIK